MLEETDGGPVLQGITMATDDEIFSLKQVFNDYCGKRGEGK